MRLAKPRPEPRIETERLVLRPLTEQDLGDLVAEINDYDIARMTSLIPHPYDEADARAYFTQTAARARAKDAVRLTIDRGGRLIGGISLFSMPRRSELGYWLGRAHWGKGYATEAGQAILAHGFEVLNLRLVHCRVACDNPASARVQQKLGFRRIGFDIGRSLARGTDVEHIHSVLPRARFLETRQ
jgi:RimJ/RimL family protein N-acetyltransferase